jgi:hypothetical protein
MIGIRIVKKYKSLGKALKMAFPEYNWDLERFSAKGKKSIQGWYVSHFNEAEETKAE